MSQYLTDGIHLYEVEHATCNYGLLGGRFLTVRDCVTEQRRHIGPLEAALCREVQPG